MTFYHVLTAISFLLLFSSVDVTDVSGFFFRSCKVGGRVVSIFWLQH